MPKPPQPATHEWMFDEQSRDLLHDILTKMLTDAGKDRCEKHLAVVDELLEQCKEVTQAP